MLFVSAPTLASYDSVCRIDPEGRVEALNMPFGRPQGLAFDRRRCAARRRGAGGIERRLCDAPGPRPGTGRRRRRPGRPRVWSSRPDGRGVERFGLFVSAAAMNARHHRTAARAGRDLAWPAHDVVWAESARSPARASRRVDRGRRAARPARCCSSARAIGVSELGLGLLLSLSPVGVFDLAKWWFDGGRSRSATVTLVPHHRSRRGAPAARRRRGHRARRAHARRVRAARAHSACLADSGRSGRVGAGGVAEGRSSRCSCIASTACAALRHRGCWRRPGSIAC